MPRITRKEGFGKRGRRTETRIARSEKKDLPGGGDSSHAGVMCWNNVDQTKTEGSVSPWQWNRSAGGGSAVEIDPDDATAVVVREPGWYQACLRFHGETRPVAAPTAETAGIRFILEPAIKWFGYDEDQNPTDNHWAGNTHYLPIMTDPTWWMAVSDVLVTPPVKFVFTPTEADGFASDAGFSAYTYPYATGATNAEVKAWGQDDSQLDGDGFPIGSDVTTFSVWKIGDL